MSTAGITYDVARHAPADVEGELCRLWGENLRLPVSAEKRFAWLYREAPDPAPAVFVLKAKSGDAGPRAVGTNGIGLRRFQLGRGVEGRAGVSGDLAVEQAHRGLLPALRLTKAVREFVVNELDVTYGFPNSKAEGVMARAGFRVLGKTTRYARVLRHGSYTEMIAKRLQLSPEIARVVTDERVARALGPIADVGRLALDAPRLARARARYRLTWGTRFDARFDDLWNRVRSEYDVVGFRTAAFLAWRYPQCEIAMLVSRDERTLVAYALIERDAASGAAHVRDIFGSKDSLGALVDLLLPALWRRGAASVSVRFLGTPYLAALLVSRGFEGRGEQRTVIVQVGKSREADRERLEDASRWHLLDVDEDS